MCLLCLQELRAADGDAGVHADGVPVLSPGEPGTVRRRRRRRTGGRVCASPCRCGLTVAALLCAPDPTVAALLCAPDPTLARHRWFHRVIHWEWQIHEWSVFAVLILQFFPQKLVPLGLCLCLSVPRMCIQLRCFSSSRCAPAIEQQNLPGVCLLKSIMFGSKC